MSRCHNYDGSEDELRSESASRKMGKQQIIQPMMTTEELEKMIPDIFHRTLGPNMDDSTRIRPKEQTELAVKDFLLKVQSEDGISILEPRRLALKFRNDLFLPIHTGEEIKGKRCDLIEVALVDNLSGQVVKSGPGANAEVEIVVLKGNLGESDNWTSEEFNTDIVQPREGEKSILVGNVFLKLDGGIGVVGNLKFRHSSTWMRQCEFKLGARVKGSLAGIYIREAMTEFFTVKDKRLKHYRNRHEPALTDDVRRLTNIGKKIHKNLQERKIDTVRDFLVLLFKDPEELKHIVGSRYWEGAVKNARKCKIDKRMECYIDYQRKTGVVFNLADQVLGVVSECQYTHIDKLSDKDKEDARKMALNAIENQIQPVSFSDKASLLQHFSALSASVNPRIPGQPEHRSNREQNIVGSEMTGACTTLSMDFAPGESRHSRSLSISDYEIVNCQPSVEAGASPATTLQEFEEYLNSNIVLQDSEECPRGLMLRVFQARKRWGLLSNVVSLAWVSKRRKKATLQKLPVRKRQRIQ